MMLKLHVVSFEVVALWSANISAGHPYADNTDTVLLYYSTRLQGAISNMTATSHLCLLLYFFHRKIVIFYFGAFFVSV